jgi:hypothetical protein
MISLVPNFLREDVAISTTSNKPFRTEYSDMNNMGKNKTEMHIWLKQFHIDKYWNQLNKIIITKYKIIKRNKIQIFRLIKSVRKGLGKRSQGFE